MSLQLRDLQVQWLLMRAEDEALAAADIFWRAAVSDAIGLAPRVGRARARQAQDPEFACAAERLLRVGGGQVR